MKRWIVIMMALAAGCGPLGSGNRAAETGCFYVAPDGDDGNPGTHRRPFATLARARDAVRKLVAAGLTHDVRVLLRGGTYYLPEGITFGPEDSGTADHSITYAARHGEHATLVGGVRITGWKPLGPTPPPVTGRETPAMREQARLSAIHAAPIPEGIEPNQLFEDDGGFHRLALARSPNQGYFRLESPVEGKPKSAFVYRAQDLDPKGWDWSEGRVFMWPTHDWFSTDKPIAGIDPETRILSLEGEGGYGIRAGNRYFVQNVLALLDAPGECHISLKERKLHAWPRQIGSAKKGLIAASAEHLITIKGEPERPVRNLHIEGIDLSIAKADVVAVSGAQDCSLRFCMVENGGRNGVHITGHAERVAVYGCLVRFHGLHGVALQGRGYDQPDVNGHHTIENNHIHHCGRLVGHGYGVRIGQSGHNRVVHNHIHHMPRYATTIKGLRYQSLRKAIQGVTFENRHDFLHSRNNLLAYNHIHHVNLDSQDTGAMESWGPGRDNVYDHNLIHDVGNTTFTLQSGLYLDDATDYFTVTNNIIYGVVGAGGDQPIYAKGIGNRIDNNILIVGPTNVSAIRSLFMADERCDHHVYTRNIIVFEGAVEPPKGAFGGGVGNIHDRGKTLKWAVDIPADGDYRIWLRYAALNKPFGNDGMDGRTTMQAEGGQPVSLGSLPDTGGWGTQRWSPAACATLTLSKGKQTLTWTNVKGGGLNWDAFVLCTDTAWKPTGVDLAQPAAGRHLVVVQAEAHLRDAEGRDRRSIYDFNNWSDDRVAEADYNLFWKPGGKLAIKGGPATGSYEKWLTLLNRKFDQHSVVADPLFVDLAKRDFRLKPASPALELGFQPIDTREIGLKPDFPKRFKRE